MLRHYLLGLTATILMYSTAHAQERAVAVPSFGNIFLEIFAGLEAK